MLILLHGASGHAGEMAALAHALRLSHQVETPDLLGHGGRPVPNGYTLEEMADDLIAWLDGKGIGPAIFLGYSLGGYLALYLARRHPKRVRGVVALATRHDWNADAIAHVVHLARPERVGAPGHPRKAELERAHGEANWAQVTDNTRNLVAGFGAKPPLKPADFKKVAVPVLVLSGDRDQLVPEAEARALAAILPKARLALFPGPAHPPAALPAATIAAAVAEFARDIEAGSFAPGSERSLAPTLVAGGLADRTTRMTLRRP